MAWDDDEHGGRAGWTGYAEVERVDRGRWRLLQPDGKGSVIEVQVQFPAGYADNDCQRIAEFVLHGLARGLDAPVAPDLERLDTAHLVREVVRLRDELARRPGSGPT